MALDAGTIERVGHNTPKWCSPAFCVKKKGLGGSAQWRMYMDYRGLNKNTGPDYGSTKDIVRGKYF